jgi:Tol biopolymer transport system component
MVAPLDREAPKGPGFLQGFQARAGLWSPDGEWFAFESNRVCNDINGMTYAIFVQDAAGAKPALQVTDCKWNAQHPKWYPPGTMGGKTLLIAAVANAGTNEPFAIASLDVSAFVAK